MTDLGKTLTELENDDWGEPNYDSHLVTTCHALRTKPLKDFDAENLRIMIGQDISLEFLIPVALEMLSKDPLAEGDFYQGDLLAAVMNIKAAYWKDNPTLLGTEKAGGP